MSVAKVSEIIATSDKSFDEALKTGIERAHKTVQNLKSAWIEDQEVVIKDGKIIEYKVELKITFVLN